MSIEDFKKQLEDTYGDDVIIGPKDSPRFSTGSLALDIALGGGWARGHFHLLVGKQSSGKSTLAAKAAAEVNKYNKETGEYDLTYSNPCGVLYVDQEFTFDRIWAKKHGFDADAPYNCIVGVSNGEQMADTVNSALQIQDFSLIIIDSLESTTGKAALEKSNEDAVMGDRARILNRAYRQWVSTFKTPIKANKDKPWLYPTILAINQIREKIGVMFGDPRVIPGGHSQLLYSSTITWMGSPKVADDDAKTYGRGEFKGLIDKNKTAPPKRNFSFEMALLDLDEIKAGQIDNWKSVYNLIKDGGFLVKEGKEYTYGGENFRVQNDLLEKLKSDPMFFKKAWDHMLQVAKD